MRLSFQERMTGSFHLLASPFEDRDAEISLDVSIERLRDFARSRILGVEGEITLAGVATKQPCRGTIAVRVATEQRIPYDLRFMGDDGKVYQLYGQRDFTVPKLADTLTSLPMSLCDEAGNEVGRALLGADVQSELGQIFRSIRLRVFS